MVELTKNIKIDYRNYVLSTYNEFYRRVPQERRILRD